MCLTTIRSLATESQLTNGLFSSSNQMPLGRSPPLSWPRPNPTPPISKLNSLLPRFSNARWVSGILVACQSSASLASDFTFGGFFLNLASYAHCWVLCWGLLFFRDCPFASDVFWFLLFFWGGCLWIFFMGLLLVIYCIVILIFFWWAFPQLHLVLPIWFPHDGSLVASIWVSGTWCFDA